MKLLTDIGMAGFLFFLVKGLLWLLLFALAYFGLVDKSKIAKWRQKLSFRKNQ
ncbi:MAG: hypothetical protein U0T84_08125 [Chitinophagales bacterium]